MIPASISPFSRARLWVGVFALLLGVALPGCKKREGTDDFQQEQNKREQHAKSLGDQGAKITHKRFGALGEAYSVDLSGAQINDSTFRELKGVKRIAELNLSKSSITDAQMDQVNELATTLMNLDLSNTAITDAGLERLTNLNVCLNLNLTGTQVTAAGVDRFKNERLARPQTKIKKMRVQMK